jgi:adenylosuccinate lyase
MNQASMHDFIASLELPSAEKDRLLVLTPGGYLGLAPELARLAIED